MYKLGLDKVEEPDIKWSAFIDHSESKRTP